MNIKSISSKIIICTCIFSISMQTYARSCTSYESDKAEYMADNAMHKIIEKYGGGRDKHIKINNCQYNSYSDVYKLDVGISWNGKLFRENEYYVSGILQFRSNGTQTNFSQTYANDNVNDLYTYAVLGALALGAAAASQPQSE